MLYLGTGRRTVRLRADEASRLLLLGGEPFEEQLVMWWNFVGRSGEEIAEYAELWNAEDDRFGVVVGYDGDRLPAPPAPARCRSRPAAGSAERRRPTRGCSAFVAEHRWGVLATVKRDGRPQLSNVGYAYDAPRAWCGSR